jgi:hypothetical protein
MQDTHNKTHSHLIKNKPVKIGITGKNQADGMGDVAHILNVGQAL